MEDNVSQAVQESLKEPFVLIVFQTACLATIFLNATFIGDMLYDIWSSGSFSYDHFFLILTIALNVMEIMNNWVSIKKFFNDYTTSTFVIDVFTLGVFYWQIHVLSQALHDGILIQPDLTQVFPFWKFILVSWSIIFICYIVWNINILLHLSKKQYSCEDADIIEGTQSKDVASKRDLKNSTAMRIIQSVVVLLLVVFVDSVQYSTPYTLAFIFYTLYHNKELNIFDILIKKVR